MDENQDLERNYDQELVEDSGLEPIQEPAESQDLVEEPKKVSRSGGFSALKFLMFISKYKILLIFGGILILVLLLLFFVVIFGGGGGSRIYSPKFAGCKTVSVIMEIDDDGFPVIETFIIEDYVAGVVTYEIGEGNVEARKAVAVATRTMAVGACMNGSNMDNVDGPIRYTEPGASGIEAANETKGEILLDLRESEETLLSVEYSSFPTGDASRSGVPEYPCEPVTCDGEFCYTTMYRSPENDSFTLSVGENFRGLDLMEQNGHCYGLSKVGSMYYEDELDYDYLSILSAFFDYSLASQFEVQGLTFGNSDGFQPRTSRDNPTLIDTDRNWYAGRNRFSVGQCTWYAQGRALEIMDQMLAAELIDQEKYDKGVDLLMYHIDGNGSQWIETNAKNGANAFSYGMTPKLGSLIVFTDPEAKCCSAAHPEYCKLRTGHVAVVEGIEEDGSIWISEGGLSVNGFDYRQVYPQNGNYDSCFTLGGFIYIID